MTKKSPINAGVRWLLIFLGFMLAVFMTAYFWPAKTGKVTVVVAAKFEGQSTRFNVLKLSGKESTDATVYIEADGHVTGDSFDPFQWMEFDARFEDGTALPVQPTQEQVIGLFIDSSDRYWAFYVGRKIDANRLGYE